MKRGSALLAALLAACQVPSQVTAFTSPGSLGSRSQQRRRSPLSSTSDAGRSGSSAGATGKATVAAAGPGRAREIATQARRRARDARSRIRRTAQAPPAPRETTATALPRITPPPQPRPQERQPPRASREPPPLNGRRTRSGNGVAEAGAGAAAAATAAARKRRRVVHSPSSSPPPPPPPPPQSPPQASSSEDVDALQRRVKEILDEYCSKAPPPEEQWPPGRRIRVRGVEIYYKDTGSRSRTGVRSKRKDRPTFVLLHGLAGSTASWDEVIGDLSEYGRVISFDRPGFGKTERVMPPAVAGLPSWRLCAKTMGENPYSADFAAKALFGVLDRLGVDKVIVVAHSLGAQVALRAARARPGTVRALVLVAPAVLNPLDSKFVMGRDPNANLFSAILNLRTRVEMTAKLAAFNLQLLQPGEAPLHAVRNMTLNGDVEARVQQNFHDRSITLGRPELVAKYIEPLRDPLWDRGLLHFYKSLQGEVQPGEQLLQNTLDVWKGPSMIVTGDDDPTVPTQSSIYVAEAMEGRLVVVESCAHIPMDEKPEVFTSAVLSFANSGEVEDAWQAHGNSAKSWW